MTQPPREAATAKPIADSQRIQLGRVAGLFGVRGWVKVFTFTEPRDNILRYPRWLLVGNGIERSVTLLDGRVQGKTLVAQLEGIADRDAAQELVGYTIEIARSELPAPAPGEYYWVDLEGLRVRTRDGQELGHVDHMLATPAHDVMVIAGERERLIPFVSGVFVVDVDLSEGVIVVDWHVED